MEEREDVRSMLPFLPLILRSSSLCWPPKANEALRALSRGPAFSGVRSGEILSDAILDLRDAVGLSSEPLAFNAASGYSIFFEELMSHDESKKWFGEVVPALASLLLQLPSLLEYHYQNADNVFGEEKDCLKSKTRLRILASQEAGIVLLSQELISALLACSLFCLFPVINRDDKDLPTINFDYLFACLCPKVIPSQENKLRCLIHYFERICLCLPNGFVSFERKVLPFKPSSSKDISHYIYYPDGEFWSNSSFPLCPFEISCTGVIEDQQSDALELDFANEYIGGGALHLGCVQEEIRFMISPELIVSMLFMPMMEDNEAIEIVGAERFSSYTGYAASFRFLGDYLDKKELDFMGRRKTRIVAIDALCRPKMKQYEVEGLLRETNKAFCGFLEQPKCLRCLTVFQLGAFSGNRVGENFDDMNRTEDAGHSVPLETLDEGKNNVEMLSNSCCEHSRCLESHQDIGVATGNWGCGAFGGDLELKSMIQWLAASQARRHFVLYYTFGAPALQRLEEVTQWVLSHEWTVSDLWNMLLEYSFQRLNGQTSIGFLKWLLPCPDDSGTHN